MINVFTDGACRNNGMPDAEAGIGVYFSKDDPRNVCKRQVGKQTNNTAELGAVIEVFKILEHEIQEGVKIVIYSDSKYTIRWCGEFGRKCEKKGWPSVPNAGMGRYLYTKFTAHDNVIIKHIKAHTGLDDELSLGNEGADMMANSAIGVDIKVKKDKVKKDNMKDRLYLEIPYSEKEVGKKYGAKWSPEKNKWYYEGQATDTNFKTLCQLFQL